MNFITLGITDVNLAARRWDNPRLPEKAGAVHIDLGNPGGYIALDLVDAKKLIEELTAVVADIEANPRPSPALAAAEGV